MFWTQKKINSQEYEYLYKRIVELTGAVEELSAKIRIVTSDNANLRGQFNRKLSGIKEKEKEEEMGEEQSINNPVILPYNGDFRKFGK